MKIVCKDEVTVDIDINLFIINTVFFKNLCEGMFMFSENKENIKLVDLSWCDYRCVIIFENYFKNKKIEIETKSALGIICDIWYLVDYLVPCIELQRDLYNYFISILSCTIKYISIEDEYELFCDETLRKYIGVQILNYPRIYEIGKYIGFFNIELDELKEKINNFRVSDFELSLANNFVSFYEMWQKIKKKNECFSVYGCINLIKPFDAFEQTKLIFKPQKQNKYFLFENIICIKKFWFDFPNLSYLVKKKKKIISRKLPIDIIIKYRLFDYRVTFKGYSDKEIKKIKKQNKYIEPKKLILGVSNNDNKNKYSDNTVRIWISEHRHLSDDIHNFVNEISKNYGNITRYSYYKEIDLNEDYYRHDYYLLIEFEKYVCAVKYFINNDSRFGNLEWKPSLIKERSIKISKICNGNTAWIYKKDLFKHRYNDDILYNLTFEFLKRIIFNGNLKNLVEIIKYLETKDKIIVEFNNLKEFLELSEENSTWNKCNGKLKWNKYSITIKKEELVSNENSDSDDSYYGDYSDYSD
jgi:hypothetical protein